VPRFSPAQLATYRAALAAFAACMRRNGIPIPPPKTNHRGEPSLSNGGANTSGVPYQHALVACRAFVSKIFPPSAAGSSALGG
jgi:hypothetical protein